MVLLGRMMHRVLGRGAIAAADVAAVRAASEVEPPATDGLALHAAGPRWRELRMDRIGCHQTQSAVTARTLRRSPPDGTSRRTGRGQPLAWPRAGGGGRRPGRARP